MTTKRKIPPYVPGKDYVGVVVGSVCRTFNQKMFKEDFAPQIRSLNSAIEDVGVSCLPTI